MNIIPSSRLFPAALTSSALVLMLTFFSCGKIEEPQENPLCVKTRINDFKKNACPDHASVRLYEFQYQMVYVFDAGWCIADGTAEVVDEHCVTLGYLGGLIGNFEIQGESFDHARYVMTVWSN